MARRKIGLVGAAVSDHPAVRDLCRKILAAGGTMGISSLRADSADAELLPLLAQGGVRSVALAPEAGSDRLRRVINKGLTRDDLARAAVDVSRAGIRQLRLYFMVGLPTETAGRRRRNPPPGEISGALRHQGQARASNTWASSP